MSRRLGEWILGHRVAVLAVLGLITVIFGFFASRIQIDTDFADLIPTRHPYMDVHRRFSEQLGGALTVFVMVEVKEGDIFNTATLEKIDFIQREVDAIPGVNHNQVISIASKKIKKVVLNEFSGLDIFPIMETVPANEEELAELRNAVYRNEGVLGPMVSFDGTTALITANFIEGAIRDRIVTFDDIFTQVRGIADQVRDDQHEVYVAGEPILTGWIHHYKGQILWILMLSIGVMVVLLFAYWRTGVGVALPVATATVSAIWGLGFTGMLGYNLDPLILVVPLLITARAISHAVQLTERYFEIYNETGDVKESAIESFASLFPPGLLGVITDAAGLYIIAVAPIPLMVKLALFCGTWVLTIVFTVQVLVPILLSYLPPPSKERVEAIVNPRKGLEAPILNFLSALGEGKRPTMVLAGTVVATIIAAILTSRLTIGDAHPGTPILWPDSEYNEAIAAINQKYPGSDQLFVIVDGEAPDIIKRPEVLHRLNEFQRFMERSADVGATVSLADFIIPMNRLLHSGDPKYELLPEDPSLTGSIMLLILAGTSPGDFDRFVSRDYQDANITVWYKDHKGDTIRRAIAQAKEFIASATAIDGIEFQLASGYMGVLAAVNEVVAGSQAICLFLLLGVILITCSITYRSFVAPLILMVPLAVANLFATAFMAVKGIGLNINTLPVATIGIGVGVDYGIYLLSRICEEYQNLGRFDAAIRTAVSTTGKAIIFTATTLVAGVIFWYFLSDLRFQAEMGLLLALLMLINMLTAVVVLPALVGFFKPRFVGEVKLLVKG
jgi:predicted RND superfamily exporter protein